MRRGGGFCLDGACSVISGGEREMAPCDHNQMTQGHQISKLNEATNSGAAHSEEMEGCGRGVLDSKVT